MKLLLVLTSVIISVYGIPSLQVPDEIDWRKKGAISAVKDQGDCEGTFYFAAVGLVESYYYLSTGESIDLSEQYCVDCSLGYNNGCNGGGLLNTLDFIRHKGTTLESSYPYEGRLQDCQMDDSQTIFKGIGFEMLPKREEDIKTTVGTIGPVGVTIKGQNLTSYTGGVYNDSSCSSGTQRHSGIVVGYGTTADSEDYWIIQMSYGANWGEDGYMRLARNENMCLIADTPLYVLYN